ncbi:high affinity copper uptake protein 1-like isoform X2 [Bacillus rossius redtenbacheri]|uniref:high affinity copper uptake protein 1-like isoform X2 n=1 Tax=Bacillus rossius redtenbacheri TaxID=93214 RepID=UPI002FDCFB20
MAAAFFFTGGDESSAAMNHSGMNHAGMDHSSMGHAGMDHKAMGHVGMDHSSMDHAGMDHSSMDHAGMDHSAMGHSMSMAFHFGYTETVLFDSWKINGVGGLIGSMIGIFIMSALYEGLKYYREYLFWKSYNALQYRAVSSPIDKGVAADDARTMQPSMCTPVHCFQTLLHVVQIILSYFLMLIFMTYNVWLCFAVVVGAATGYFLFGWKKSVIVDVTEHCH